MENADATQDEFIYAAPEDATRYQPGHPSYLGYCAAFEGLKFIQRVGVQAALEHSVALNQRLKSQIDSDRYKCISPHIKRSPMITFKTKESDGLRKKLMDANVVVSLGGNRLRVSPALYNTEADIDILSGVLNN